MQSSNGAKGLKENQKTRLKNWLMKLQIIIFFPFIYDYVFNVQEHLNVNEKNLTMQYIYNLLYIFKTAHL